MTTIASMTEPITTLLQLSSVSVRFGGLLALCDINLDVAQGERLAILGPNGAGKTTMFNVVAGDIRPTEGQVAIKGIDCTSLPSRRRPSLGVARTYQRTRLFAGLTVEDNLYLALIGTQGRHRSMRRTVARRAVRGSQLATQPKRCGSATMSSHQSATFPMANNANSRWPWRWSPSPI